MSTTREKEYKKRYYDKNKERHMELVRRAKLRRMEYLRSVKQEAGCLRCGIRNPIVLQFHHSDPGRKEFSVSDARFYSKKKLDEEIGKCVVLCANCHLIEHASVAQQGRAIAS